MLYLFWYAIPDLFGLIVMPLDPPTLQVHFFRSEGGTEPVRDWIKGLSAVDRRTVGEDLKTVQFGWPLGMPLVRKMQPGLWEVRSP